MPTPKLSAAPSPDVPGVASFALTLTSLSVIVAVCCVVAPWVAFVGVPMVTITVSSPSTSVSLTTVMSIVVSV